MARTALINSSRFSKGTSSGLKLRANPLSAPAGISQSLNSIIPLPAELAFNRKDISGTSYKSIVDSALEKAIPGTTLYSSLLKEQSKAISRINDEEQKAIDEGRKIARLKIEAQAASTKGNTAQDAVNSYNFWIGEANKAANQGDAEYYYTALKNANSARTTATSKATSENNKYLGDTADSLAKQWSTEDSSFNSDLSYLNEQLRKGNMGTLIINGQSVDEYSRYVAKTYQDWIDVLKSRQNYLSVAPSLEDKMPSKYKVAGLDNMINGKTTINGNQTASLAEQLAKYKGYLATIPGLLAQIADPQTGAVEEKVAPVDLSTYYIRDEYGIYHEVTKVANGDGTSAYVARIFKPDGSIISVQSDNFTETTNQKVFPDQIKFYLRQADGTLSKNPIVDLGNVSDHLKGRLALTGADIGSTGFIKDVLNINDPTEIQRLRSDIQFNNLKQTNPEFARKADIFSADYAHNLRNSLNNEYANYYAQSDNVLGSLNSQIQKNASDFEKLRVEGLQTGNLAILNKAEQALTQITNLKQQRDAELQRYKPLPVVTGNQLSLLEKTPIAPPPTKNNIITATPVLTQAAQGAGLHQVLAPPRETKPIEVPGYTLNSKGQLVPAAKKTPPPTKSVVKTAPKVTKTSTFAGFSYGA